jgi:hypothetical protein
MRTQHIRTRRQLSDMEVSDRRAYLEVRDTAVHAEATARRYPGLARVSASSIGPSIVRTDRARNGILTTRCHWRLR